MNLTPQQTKALKIGGALAGATLATVLIARAVRRSREAREERQQAALAPPGSKPPKKDPKADKEKLWAPDQGLWYGNPYERMTTQLQYVINSIAKLTKDKPIKVDGDFGSITQKRVTAYFGQNNISYNDARAKAVSMYKMKGLSYPDGKPIQDPSVPAGLDWSVAPSNTPDYSSDQWAPGGSYYNNIYQP